MFPPSQKPAAEELAMLRVRAGAGRALRICAAGGLPVEFVLQLTEAGIQTLYLNRADAQVGVRTCRPPRAAVCHHYPSPLCMIRV